MSASTDNATKLAALVIKRVREFVQPAIDSLSDQDQALLDRIKQLEQRTTALAVGKGLEYRGIFDDGALYHSGDLVTHAGTLWFCKEETHDRPGTERWQLMVKTK